MAAFFIYLRTENTKMIFRLLTFLPTLAWFINCLPYINRTADDHLVRVAVVCAADSVTVSGSRGNKYYQGFGLSLRDSFPQFFKPVNGRIVINGIAYRGALEIRRDQDALWAINVLDMEEYLKGVVPCEIGRITRAQMEAAKAQAVAARTYAAAHRRQYAHIGFDLYATVQDQVYEGLRAENDLINEAVDKTQRQIITDHGQAIEAKYHSTCGGQTADFNDAWPGQGPPYLHSVSCGYCQASPHYNWKKTWTKSEFFRHLRQRLSKMGIELADREFITGLRLYKNQRSQRIRQIKIITTRRDCLIPAHKIRTLFGDERDPGGLLKSNWFQLKIRADTIVIEGRGFGHGVGLCQWGCLEMARQGRNYRDILRHYYPGTKITRY